MFFMSVLYCSGMCTDVHSEETLYANMSRERCSYHDTKMLQMLVSASEIFVYARTHYHHPELLPGTASEAKVT